MQPGRNQFKDTLPSDRNCTREVLSSPLPRVRHVEHTSRSAPVRPKLHKRGAAAAFSIAQGTPRGGYFKVRSRPAGNASELLTSPLPRERHVEDTSRSAPGLPETLQRVTNVSVAQGAPRGGYLKAADKHMAHLMESGYRCLFCAHVDWRWLPATRFLLASQRSYGA